MTLCIIFKIIIILSTINCNSGGALNSHDLIEKPRRLTQSLNSKPATLFHPALSGEPLGEIMS